jgi:hypothetical protein
VPLVKKAKKTVIYTLQWSLQWGDILWDVKTAFLLKHLVIYHWNVPTGCPLIGGTTVCVHKWPQNIIFSSDETAKTQEHRYYSVLHVHKPGSSPISWLLSTCKPAVPSFIGEETHTVTRSDLNPVIQCIQRTDPGRCDLMAMLLMEWIACYDILIRMFKYTVTCTYINTLKREGRVSRMCRESTGESQMFS